MDRRRDSCSACEERELNLPFISTEPDYYECISILLLNLESQFISCRLRIDVRPWPGSRVPVKGIRFCFSGLAAGSPSLAPWSRKALPGFALCIASRFGTEAKSSRYEAVCTQ